MKFIKRNLSVLFLFLTSYLINPVSAHAQTAWQGRCVNGDVATIQGLECLFGNVISVVVMFAGLAFFVMFIMGGFNYLTSEGDDKKVAAASAALTSSIIGLVGVIGAFLILRFIQTFTGANVTNFIIPG